MSSRQDESPAAVLKRMRSYVQEGRTRPLRARLETLSALAALFEKHETALLEAVRLDLGRPALETFASELSIIAAEIRYARRHLRRWMRPQRRRVPPALWPARARVQHEPLGVILVMAPWNYPIQLLVSPLVGALAAGNAAILKPSEGAPHTSHVIAECFAESMPQEWVSVFEGDARMAASLVDLGVDKICFTGSTTVGREVMTAAARHLTPVLLELGGKCPCIVFADADPTVAARRIAWGKFLNAGQTCVAPDHVYVDESIREEFLVQLATAIRDFYGERPRESPDYGRLASRRHVERLQACLEGVDVSIGGECDAAECYVAPTVVLDPPKESRLMQEEIFGPVLPVISFREPARVLESIRSRPHPLAFYLFGREQEQIDHAIESTVSGGVCINDTLVQLTPSSLPFGGVGSSGMGAYRGRTGFEAFSHSRSVVSRSMWPELPFRYPPYRSSVNRLRALFRWFVG